MIDEEWLRGLQFDSPQGRVNGIVSVSGEAILFRCTGPDGTDLVWKVRYGHLGMSMALRELPMTLTLKPEYDLQRLNNKLLRFVGNPSLDSTLRPYGSLYTPLIAQLHQHGVAGLLRRDEIAKYRQDLIFILRTPGIQVRLQDMAALKRGPRSQEESQFLKEVSFSPEMFIRTIPLRLFGWPVVINDVRDIRYRIVLRARKNLWAIRRLPHAHPDLYPEKLPENPLYLWGAAIVDGFFTDEELPAVTDFLTNHFGSLPQHPQAETFARQLIALLHLLQQSEEPHYTYRFIKLCQMTGLITDITEVLAFPGEAYLDGGRYEEALAIFNKALSTDPQQVEALTLRGETYRQMGRLQEALEDLNHALELDPHNARALTYRGETYVVMGCQQEALEDFTHALELDPKNFEAFANRGERYFRMGRNQEALEDFDRALEIDGKDVSLLIRRSILQLRMGHLQEALNDSNRAIDIRFRNPSAHVQRGVIHFQLEQYNDALQDLNNALSIDPSNIRALTIRGQVYIAQQRYTDALADFDRVLSQYPQDENVIALREEVLQHIKS